MRPSCRVLVVEALESMDEVFSIVDEITGCEATAVMDREAAFIELDRGALKAAYTVAIIGSREPERDLKLVEYAALRGCAVIVAVEDDACREPFLARGYDLVELPCRAEELIVRVAAARLRAGLAEKRLRRQRGAESCRGVMAASRRRRRVPAFASLPAVGFFRAAV